MWTVAQRDVEKECMKAQLPLATIDLGHDNREFKFEPYFQVLYLL